ncbi:MAG: DUF1570 domain-containing protein [Planctomycetota bacterium]|jgi:tetratricopeptide (TPR) repeat protein
MVTDSPSGGISRIFAPAGLRFLLPLFLLSFLVPAEIRGEELHLKSGKKMKGELRSSRNGIILKVGRREKEFSWGEIDWIVHRTKKFVFWSRILPEKTRDYGEAFEQFAKALPAIFKFKAPMRKNWTRQVRIFRDEKEFLIYRGKDDPAMGYFRVDDDNCVEEVVMIDIARDPSETFDTLLHEGTHLMLYLWGKAKEFDFPRWIDEGMAEYFGGSMYRPSAKSLKNVYSTGLVKPWRWMRIKKQLEKGEAVPLAKFFLMGYDEFEGRHYAQAWSLIHFFAHYKNGARAKLLYKYCHELMRTVREGERAVALFQKIFRYPLPKLEEEWKKYVLELKPRTPEDRLALAEAYEWRGESEKAMAACGDHLYFHPQDYRAMVIKARALSWKGKYPEAFALLKEATELQPEYPDLHRSRALLLFESEKWAESKSAYEKYLSMAPMDLLISLEYMRCLLVAPPPHRSPKTVLDWGKPLLVYHDDWELLLFMGQAACALGDQEQGLDYLKKAEKLSPDNPRIKEALARAKKGKGQEK